MFIILGWVLYGLIVGTIAKILHPGDDPDGFFTTILIGIAGSYVGGLFNWMIGVGEPFSTSGILMGILGAILFLWIWKRFRAK